jgi:hypothetical protein
MINSLPNKTRSPIPSASDVNQALDAIRQNRAVYGAGHMTTRGFIPVRKRARNGSSIPLSAYVRVAGKKIAISGTVARYVWVNYSTNPPTATYSSTDMDEMPNNIEIYDTSVREIHIPRLG